MIWNPAVVEGVGAGYARPSRTGKPFTFGYLGRIAFEKGVGTILEAGRKVTGDWRLIVAGRAVNGLEPFEELAEGLPVEFLGFVEPKAFFESVDVLIVPSIWAEPLPRTILESYAMGVPALGAAVGGIPELIGADNTDWLFPGADHDALARHMNRLVAAGREALPGLGSFASVLEETTPDVVVNRYLDLYRGALAQKGVQSAPSETNATPASSAR